MEDPDKAWELFKDLESLDSVSGTASYRTNWDNCMKCSIIRSCIASNQPQNLEVNFKHVLDLIATSCDTDYSTVHGMACPERCVMSLYEKAANSLPDSPFVNLFNTINTCLDSYSEAKKKEYVTECFVTANSLLTGCTQPDWSPEGVQAVPRIHGGSMDMMDLDATYKDLFTDPAHSPSSHQHSSNGRPSTKLG